jgi:hypothetical protein
MMIKNICSAIVLCLITQNLVFAQYQLDAISSVWDIHKNKWIDSTAFQLQTQVNIFGEAGFNSNAITNEFLKAYAIKSSVVHRLKPSNRYGIVAQAGICAQYAKDKLAFEVGYKNTYINSTRFSEDAFNLMFYGNKMFEGKHASLDPFSIYSYHAHSIFAGVKKQVKDNLIVGARLGYVRGADLQYVSTQQASLFTETNGASLQLNGTYEIVYASENNNTTYNPTSGNGASIDLNMAWYKGRSSFTADVYDIGFIQWKNVSTYNASGTQIYNGFDIGNIFGTGGFQFDEVNLDSALYAFGLEKKIQSKTLMLPAHIRLCYSYDFHSKYQIQAGLNYRFQLSNIPQAYLRLTHYITPTWIIIPGVSYGGFGKANVNLAVSKLWKDKFIFSLQAMGLGYYALPTKTSGIGLDIQLIYKL